MNLATIFPIQPLTTQELINLLPLFVLSFGAIITLLLGTHKQKGRGYAFLSSLTFLVTGIVQALMALFSSDVTLLGGTLTFSPFTKTVSVMLMILPLS